MATAILTSRFHSDMAQALERRGRRLLEAGNLEQRVPALEPLEAYFVIKELGVDDATPLLRHVSGEQLRTFVDLDCWRGERPDAVELDAWLAPFAALGSEALAEAFLRLDHEVQVLFLRQSLIVYENDEDQPIPDPEEESVRRTSPDGYFVVDVPQDREYEVNPHQLLQALYDHDVQLGYRLLTAVLWELASPLEEQAFEFRSARLEELGFPSRLQAASLFAAPPDGPPPAVPMPKAPRSTKVPAIYAKPLSENCLLARALAFITDPIVLSVIEEDLRNVINHAIIAYGGSPRNVQHAAAIAGRVRDILSLGLESCLSPEGPLEGIDSEDSAKAAGKVLEKWTVFNLFRRGHWEVLEMRKAVAPLLADPVITAWRNKGDTEQQDYGEERMDREFVNALLDDPPLRSGFAQLNPGEKRAFGSKAQLQEAIARAESIAEQLLQG